MLWILKAKYFLLFQLQSVFQPNDIPAFLAVFMAVLEGIKSNVDPDYHDQ